MGIWFLAGVSNPLYTQNSGEIPGFDEAGFDYYLDRADRGDKP
jgi:hypothetical protein